MTKEKLIDMLEGVYESQPEEGIDKHNIADALLIHYVNDEEIKEAYERIRCEN